MIQIYMDQLPKLRTWYANQIVPLIRSKPLHLCAKVRADPLSNDFAQHLTRLSDDDIQHILLTPLTELFDRYGVEYNILTVVNRKVAAGIEQIYAFYKKKGWRYLQFIPCLEPFGAEPGKQKFSVTPEQYGTFLVRLYELWYEDYKKGEQPYIRQFENYAAILMGYLPEACDQRGTCGLQHVVEADGTVYPCDFYAVDEYRIGNFNENTFAEIQKKRDGIRFVERSENISGRCGRCDYYRLCRGGCQRNRVFDPETETYHNYFCESYQMLLSEFSALWKK